MRLIAVIKRAVNWVRLNKGGITQVVKMVKSLIEIIKGFKNKEENKV